MSLTGRVETKSKPNWLVTQGTNPAEQLRREFSSAGTCSIRGCWDWLVVNPLDRGKDVKHSIFPGFRSVKSGIQSKAPPSLLTLTGVGCDQAAPAEKCPSIFTLTQFPPCTFCISSMEGLCFYPESDLSPGSSSWTLVQICWGLKVLFLQETPPVSYNFLHVFILLISTQLLPISGMF